MGRQAGGQEGRVAIIGAGVAGLSAAAILSARGMHVTLLDRAPAPGGKMREVAVGATRQDAGPTVLTLRPVLEALFQAAGSRLSDHVTLTKADILARHAWDPGPGGGDAANLDLFADLDRSAEAISALAGPAEGRGYRRFVADAARMFRTLDKHFIRSPQPSMAGLMAGVGPFGLGDLWAIKPFETLWGALGGYFQDPRLRQLFGRYATYCGSSPFQAPATLMLVAHVEQAGVWLVEGGMHRLAQALSTLAQRNGATVRYGAEAREILVERGRAAGVLLADGEVVEADAVIHAGDVAALGDGLLGPGARQAAPTVPRQARSLSALTWSVVARAGGFPLKRHTVFFSRDYRAEFDTILEHRRLPAAPTVYVCAHDRGAGLGEDAVDGPERLLVLVNAPADGDSNPVPLDSVRACGEATAGLLARCGLELSEQEEVVTTPADFATLFPASGGALYGRASHGWQASFQRPGILSRIPGLFLAGGSVHPGPGVPMAALSGHMAAAQVLAALEKVS